MEDKNNFYKLLKIAIIMFFIIASINIGLNIYFNNRIKIIQKKNFASIESLVQNIKIQGSQNNYKIIIDQESAEQIKALSDKNYKEFIIQYNENQSNWFNTWLTILSIILGVLGLIIPICFMKLYYDKKDEIDKLIDKTETQKVRIEEQKEKFEDKLEKMNKLILLLDSHGQTMDNLTKESKKHKEEMDKIIEDTQKQKDKMQLQVDKVELKYEDIEQKSEQVSRGLEEVKKYLNEIKQKSEQTSKDLNKVKKFYDETKAESEFADLLYKYNNNKESKQRIAHGLKHILRVKPKHIGACTTLACIYVDEGKYIEAVDYAKKAYKYSGQDKSFLYNIIETLLLSEQFEAAIKYLKQYKNYEYAKIYEEDYEKWVNQINKIADENKKNLALDIINKLPKIKQNSSPLKLAADKINKEVKENESNDK